MLEEEGSSAFPPLDVLMETRMEGIEGGFFRYLCEYFLPCIIGKKIWMRRRSKTPVSEIANYSDEAVCQVILENSYGMWLAEAKHVIEKRNKKATFKAAIAEMQENERPRFIYTGGTDRPNANNGWSAMGLSRFNALFARAKEDRAQEQSKLNERAYMEICKQIDGPGKEPKTKRQKVEEVVDICNDCDETDLI